MIPSNQNTDKFFGWVTAKSLIYFILSFSVLWLAVYLYVSSQPLLSILNAFLGVVLIWKLITLFPVVIIWRALRKNEEKIECEVIIGVWEKTVIGFYFLSNLVVMLVLLCFSVMIPNWLSAA